MKNFFVLITINLFAFSAIFAQVANDECETAISVPANFCSGVSEYTNSNATESGYGAATCMSNALNDVWYSFVAVAPDVTITVTGSSLSSPQVALYVGNCGGTINQLGCESGGQNVELYEGGLTVGQVYLIRIDGANSATGTFQLCTSNYNPPVNPGSDCQTRAFLCDKSSFVVQSVSGPGSVTNELQGTCLEGGQGNAETNSTWFAWTCRTSGSLTFTLTPTFYQDDLDFIVYELPNGIDNCSGKIARRCNAAGDESWTSPCMGETGLSATANDTTEEPGCFGGNDGWVSALDMQAGVSYALVVNNFSATGNGFSIEFGGTGEFQGPEARFNTNDADNSICIGDDLTFTDASTTSLGTIVGYSWNFGVDAVPATAGGVGPHNVSYNSIGTKSVVLTVENSLGCIVTEIVNIIVDPCCETDNAMTIVGQTNELECYDDPDGTVDITVDSPFPITSYEWSNLANTEDISGLTGGDYTVTVTNQFCENTMSFNVFSPPPFEFDIVNTLATCNGGVDGDITVNVSGATPPFEFNWYDGSGFVLGDNYRDNLPIGLYDLTVRDGNGCEKDLVLEVKELELELDPDVDASYRPSCFGFSDGRIELIVANGLPPYQYDWNDGLGYVNTNTLENITAGIYDVTIRDANGCLGVFTFNIGEPALLEADLDSLDVSCFGEADGMIIPQVSGGTYPYNYLWSNGQTDSVAVDLIAGTYSLTVTDMNGCITEGEIEVIQPPELLITGIDVLDVVCFGESSGELTVHATGGNPPYLYSYDGLNFQEDSVLVGIPAGTFSVVVLDGLDCTEIQAATITQPPELIADAGPDLTVALGYSTELEGSHSPPNKPVTIEWSPDYNLSCRDCFQPTATPYETTTYYLTITDNTDCTDVDSMTVFVNKERPVFIPNAFTPNGDGANDVFTAFGGPAVSQIDELQIYDRWGGLMYKGVNLPPGTDVYEHGWDGRSNGKKMNANVYVYLMRIRFVDGFVGLYKGDVTLVD